MQEICQSEYELFNSIQMLLDNKASYGNLEESQFRNLLRIAEITDSTEIIKNFLRYQIGRDHKLGNGETSLAFKIIQDIDGKILELARTIAQENKIENLNSIWLGLVRRYLSYGMRYLQIINSAEIHQIEQSINTLSREKQLLLVERIIHNIRFSTAQDTNIPTPETLEKQLENMANDPEIQAEIKRINQEFMITEMDGLMDCLKM